MMNARFFPFFVAALGTVMFCPASHAQTESKPNLVVVSIDTLRADHCSTYGYRRDTTPRLTRLAHEGVLFRQAYAPMGQTGPSHATLFTGLYPTKHGLIKNGRVLPDAQVTLAERLAAAGYDTAAFVSAFPMERRFGLQQGFASYDDEFPQGQHTIDLNSWEGERPENAFDRRGDFTVARAVDWLGNRAPDAAPFFLFVHLFDPHSPYRPSREAFAQILGDDRPRDLLKVAQLRYDGEIRFADNQLARLLDALDKTGASGDTIVVVTSDHGEGLMQRGFLLHGVYVYEEEVHVPLAVRWPDHLPAGRVLETPVTSADITPTLLALLGLESNDAGFQGNDLSQAMTVGERLPVDRPIFFMRPRFTKKTIPSGWSERMADGRLPPRISVNGAHYGVRLDVWKYIIAPEEGTTELYNLQTDPGETTNLRERHESIANVMHGHINRWLEDAPADSTAEELLDDETRQALEALGYTN